MLCVLLSPLTPGRPSPRGSLPGGGATEREKTFGCIRHHLLRLPPTQWPLPVPGQQQSILLPGWREQQLCCKLKDDDAKFTSVLILKLQRMLRYTMYLLHYVTVNIHVHWKFGLLLAKYVHLCYNFHQSSHSVLMSVLVGTVNTVKSRRCNFQECL